MGRHQTNTIHYDTVQLHSFCPYFLESILSHFQGTNCTSAAFSTVLGRLKQLGLPVGRLVDLLCSAEPELERQIRPISRGADLENHSIRKATRSLQSIAVKHDNAETVALRAASTTLSTDPLRVLTSSTYLQTESGRNTTSSQQRQVLL